METEKVEGMMSHLTALSHFVMDCTFEDLPHYVVESAKLRILDYIGIALSGNGRGIHKPLMEAFKNRSANGKATVIGERTRLPYTDAAFVNCAMCTPDMTDGARVAGLHPGVIVIPAALAASEQLLESREVSGRDLILAVCLGYEVMIRIGQAMTPSATKRGFHLTSIAGGLGSTTAVAKLWGFSQNETMRALSLACTWSAGLFTALKAPEPFAHMQIAQACRNGIDAALLSRSGVPGDERILEDAFLPAFCGKSGFAEITASLGHDYGIAGTYVKMHAGCRHLHAPMDAAYEVVKKQKIPLSEIEQIKIKTYSAAQISEILHPNTGDEAKYNTPFGVAVLLVHGNAFVDKFSERYLNDERVRDLMNKITLEHDPELDKEYPAKRAAKVELRMRNGSTLFHRLDLAKGEPETPFTQEEIERKFNQMASLVLDRSSSEKIVSALRALERSENIRNLFQILGK